jgi:hypothetical protein
VTRLTVNYRYRESDVWRSAPYMEDKDVLMLALRIAIAWTAFSLLCVALWVLILETGQSFGSGKPREFHRNTDVGFWP